MDDDDIPIPAGLQERNLARVRGSLRRRRIRTRVLVAGVAVVGAGALTAAAAVVLVPKPIEDRTAWCFSSADVNASHQEVQSDFRSDASDPVGSALDNCTALWTNGLLTAPGVATGQAPGLVPCRNGDGVIWVFPREAGDGRDDAALCQALALQPASRR